MNFKSASLEKSFFMQKNLFLDFFFMFLSELSFNIWSSRINIWFACEKSTSHSIWSGINEPKVAWEGNYCLLTSAGRAGDQMDIY